MNGKPLILVADDEDLVLDLVCEALTQLDCRVEKLNDGLEVIDVVTLKCPDLVILDCSMPGLSGVSALRQIRASDDRSATPVLMLTGRRAAADEAIALRAGADYYMRKPFEQDELLTIVEFILAKNETRANVEFSAKVPKIVPSASRRSINLT